VNPLRVVWLVGRRELLERGRSRAFLLGLVLTQALIVGSFALQGLIIGDAGRVKLGTVGDVPANARGAMSAVAGAIGATLTITPFDNLDDASAALRRDDVASVLVGPDVAQGAAGAGELLVKDRPDSRLQTIVQGACRSAPRSGRSQPGRSSSRPRSRSRSPTACSSSAAASTPARSSAAAAR